MEKEKKKFNKKKIIIILIILSLMSILAGTIYWYISSRLNKINYIYIDKSEITINEGVEESLSGYRNIAILGIDSYAEEYEESGRSDCIIIATLNEKTKEVKLTSVYRDTYVEIPGIGLDKINHAYAFGGPKLALSTINVNLDLNITEVVVVNFDSVVNAIDAIGGVEMYITAEETKYINGYIQGISKKTGIKTQRITKAGTYTLDGVQALAYSRIRYTQGGDHKRTERQRLVLNKMFEKVKKMNKADALNALDEILPIITTNIKKDEIISILLELNKYKLSEGMGWPYNVRAYDESGPWYGVPVTLESDVIRLHKEVFGQKNYIPTQTIQEISRKIIEKTGFAE